MRIRILKMLEIRIRNCYNVVLTLKSCAIRDIRLKGVGNELHVSIKTVLYR